MMIKKAIRFAIDSHGSQFRKGTTFPYIEHPIHVGILLTKANQRSEVVVAGILHDILEDTDVRESQIISEFGNEVLMLIKAASEPDRTLSWKERKTHTINYLKNASREIQILALCDKHSNLMDIENDVQQMGEALWQRFNAGKLEQKWYYESLAESLRDLSENEIYCDFVDRINKVFV